MNVLGVNTYSYIWSTALEDCVRRLSEVGYHEFEAVINPRHFAPGDLSPAERRRLAVSFTARKIVLRSLNVPSLDHNLASPMCSMREYSVGLFRDVIDLAADFGVPYVVTVPGRMNPLFPPTMAEREAWMRESLDTLIPYAEKRGINLALENVPFASFPDAPALGRFARSVGSQALSVCYDAANAHFIGESPADGVRLLADIVSLVHVSDTTRTTWRHDEVGRGDLPFADFRAALSDIGFGGPCMMEIIDPSPEPAILRSHWALSSVGFAAPATTAAFA